MRESASAHAARARRGLTTAEFVVLGVATSLFVGTAVVIVPGVVRAGEGDAEPRVDAAPSNPAHVESVAKVRELVEAGGAVIHADGTRGEYVFWYRDEDDRGYPNEEELVGFRYSPTLGAFTVTRIESRGSWSDRVDLGVVSGPALFSFLASHVDAVTDVLSAGFEDVRLETTRQREGELTLGFAFRWGLGKADAQRDEAGFSVSLPSIGGAGGIGAGERP